MAEKSPKLPDELRQRMPWRYAMAFTSEWGSIALATVAVSMYPKWYVFVAAICIVGTRQHALSLLGHDAAHRLVSRRLWLNDFVMNLFVFWPLATCGNGYREWHLEHHRHTRDELDPEYSVVHGWLYRIPSSRLKFALSFVADMLGLGILDILNFQWQLRPRGTWHVIRLMLFWIVVFGIAWLTGTWIVLLVWFLSVSTVLQAVVRVRAWSEHQGVEGTLRFQPGLVRRILFYPYNTWCHYEHHVWPSVSCFNLPKTRSFDTTIQILSEAEMYSFFGGEFDMVKGVNLSRDVKAARGSLAKS